MTFYVWKESQEEFKFFLESEFIRESCNWIMTITLTKGWGLKRQPFKLFTVANLHFQLSW